MDSDNQTSKNKDIIRQLKNIITFGTKPNSANANLIVKNLWLGNCLAAHDIDFVTQQHIKYIINVTDDVPNKFPFINYTSYKIKDIYACHKNLFRIINEAADIIHHVLSSNSAILVHCKQGHHRSATIVVFYLMKYQDMSLIDAVKFVKNIRPNAFRRINCMLKTLIIDEN